VARPFPRTRAVTTGVLTCGSAVALVLLPGLAPLPVLVLGYVLVLAIGRTPLRWTHPLPGALLVRIAIRVGIFFLPLVALGPPALVWSTPGALAAVALAAAGLAVEWRNIRRSFRPALLEAMPYRNNLGRIRDVVLYGGSGFAQEYFYRGVGMAALTPFIGWWAVPVTAAMFVVEHVAQAGEVWDRHDVIWQAVLGIGLGTVVALTGSLPAAVLGHVLYNAPNLVHSALRPTRGTPTRTVETA
jgi:hypothetical protein